jgi:hypothetical protein
MMFIRLFFVIADSLPKSFVLAWLLSLPVYILLLLCLVLRTHTHTHR